MIELQVISKILTEGSMELVFSNGITAEYFSIYDREYEYILDHYNKYNSVPDIETFLDKHEGIQILDVREPDKYLLEAFREQYTYNKTVPVINKVAEMMQGDAHEAVNYLQSQIPDLIISDVVNTVDIISQADMRYKHWKDRKDNPDKYTIATGLKELDNIIHGLQRGEELMTIFARTGEGKSWVLFEILKNCWRQGAVVGLVEPEMSHITTGFRFDTLHNHFSNTALMTGLDLPEYEDYIAELRTDATPFYVNHPKDFNNNVTVSALKNHVVNKGIDVLAIDGITYLKDERRAQWDNKSTMLTNISEDLMSLSIELEIPCIVVAQSNRTGDHDSSPELSSIRDSDGIAFNSSKVLSLKQDDGVMSIYIPKNRMGKTGDTLSYKWDIDKGKMQYIMDSRTTGVTAQDVSKVKEKYNDSTEVF